MRKRTKRQRGLVVVLSLIGLIAAACGGSSGSSSGTGAPSSKNFGVNATGVVHFWARAATSSVAKQTVKEFNASHQDLTVKLTQTQPNQATTKLATAIRAGSPPDLIGLNDINMPIFTRKGSFMDLTSYVNKLPYKDALSPGHLNLATYQGRYYGVPYLADLSVLWYNKALFRKAGLDPNEPPTNFADILRDARKISALGGGVYGFSFAGNCQGCLGFTILPDIWATNTHLITGKIGSQQANISGNAPLKAVLQLYRQIWADHLIPPSGRTEDGTTWGKKFLAGKVGILPGGYGTVTQNASKDFRSKVGVIPLPGPDGGYSTFDGGDDFAIPKGADNPSGAWEFVKFVLQKKHQREYPDLGFTPVRTDILTSRYKAEHPFNAVALKALAKGYAPRTTAYNTTFNQQGGPWFAMFNEAVYKGNVDKAISEAQSGFTQTLEQAGS